MFGVFQKKRKSNHHKIDSSNHHKYNLVAKLGLASGAAVLGSMSLHQVLVSPLDKHNQFQKDKRDYDNCWQNKSGQKRTGNYQYKIHYKQLLHQDHQDSYQQSRTDNHYHKSQSYSHLYNHENKLP